MDFAGQHVVITGASTGIGRATAARAWRRRVLYGCLSRLVVPAAATLTERSLGFAKASVKRSCSLVLSHRPQKVACAQVS